MRTARSRTSVGYLPCRVMTPPSQELESPEYPGRFTEGIETNSIESLSSLHAVEHFGLGRYGDRVDPTAARRAMTSLARVRRPGGILLFSVPIGRERVVFNAHRIFAPESVPLAMSSLQLVSFSAVDDSGRLVVDCTPRDFGDADYACGLYAFTKPPSASL